ncbi:hypothetical protein OpiT1DRAFT_03866 [Opitutaceae bacterium TAV1]|nr:hypothetical protein OpiT1DRAFT_03866 [Opitutaceae bacterium TAV1]
MHTEPPADIGHELREIRATLARLEAPMLALMTRKLSRRQQARKAGVSVRTIQRREKRERLRLMADGRL